MVSPCYLMLLKIWTTITSCTTRKINTMNYISENSNPKPYQVISHDEWPPQTAWPHQVSQNKQAIMVITLRFSPVSLDTHAKPFSYFIIEANYNEIFIKIALMLALCLDFAAVTLLWGWARFPESFSFFLFLREKIASTGFSQHLLIPCGISQSTYFAIR